MRESGSDSKVASPTLGAGDVYYGRKYEKQIKTATGRSITDDLRRGMILEKKENF